NSQDKKDKKKCKIEKQKNPNPIFVSNKFYAVLYVVVPILLNVFLESCNRKSIVKAFGFIVYNPLLFVYGYLIVTLTLLVALFFKKRLFAFLLVTVVWIVFGITDLVLLSFRITPFSAVDFMLIISAIDVADHYFTVLQLILLILAIIVGITFFVFLFIKSPLVTIKNKKWYLKVVGLIGLDCLLLMLFSQFPPINSLKSNYTNITEVYEKYGFVFCFADSVIDSGIEKPDEYSNEAIDSLLAGLKNEENNTDKPNIIFVQLESFFDVYSVNGLEFSTDPMPNFHSLQSKYSNGYFTVPTVGAGTVNTEFEILTAMNQHDFGTSEYPYKTKLKETSCESICYDLKELGYATHAIHNNTAKFYGRNEVFANLGFDTFQTVEYMRNVKYNPNKWAMDNILTDEIIDALDSTQETDFCMTITVQSHGKYDIPDYIPEHVEVTGAPEGMEGQFNYFVNQCYEVDQMIGELTKALEERDEKTIVLFYGDHLPTLGLTKEDLINGTIYQTEYVIWDNFDLKQRDINLASYQAYPYVLDLIGIHNGVVNKFHQQYDWNDPDYMDNLKELEYDFLYGNNYIYGGENPFVPTTIQMGTHPIEFFGVDQKFGKYYAYGKYFSDNTKLYFNGKKIETTVISSDIIQIDGEFEYDEEAALEYEELEDEKKAEVEEPNSFKIVVEDKNEEILSETAPISWKER
nr:LTA synthase family protein [Lachnospiraceae bacterium]